MLIYTVMACREKGSLTCHPERSEGSAASAHESRGNRGPSLRSGFIEHQSKITRQIPLVALYRKED
jgi:hypothetical protein